MRNSTKKDALSQETKEALKTALIELYAVHPVSKISINQLCAKAGVSRGSFYYHYANIYELLEAVEDDIINDINICVRRNSLFEGIISRSNGMEPGNSVAEYIYLLDYLEQNRRAVSILYLGSDSSFFRDKLFQMTLGNLKTAFTFFPPRDDTQREYISVYMASGIVATYMKWLIDGMREPKELIAEVIMDAAGKIFSPPAARDSTPSQ